MELTAQAIDVHMGQQRSALVRDDIAGHFLSAREGLLFETQQADEPVQRRMLAWLRDHVDPGIPRAWYRLALGHDLHASMWAELFVKHYHATEPDPFTGHVGWLENVGLSSVGKVSAAFVAFEANSLAVLAPAYSQFYYHEVGLLDTLEANTDTALALPSGIARAVGTQSSDGISAYSSTATVIADTAETWLEHGIFNALTGPTLLDRSVLDAPRIVAVADQVLFTYRLVKQAEA